jgi:hypothetical protein
VSQASAAAAEVLAWGRPLEEILQEAQEHWTLQNQQDDHAQGSMGMPASSCGRAQAVADTPRSLTCRFPPGQVSGTRTIHGMITSGGPGRAGTAR